MVSKKNTDIFKTLFVGQSLQTCLSCFYSEYMLEIKVHLDQASA